MGSIVYLVRIVSLHPFPQNRTNDIRISVVVSHLASQITWIQVGSVGFGERVGGGREDRDPAAHDLTSGVV